ncbi:MAG: Rrf2 family transcriptional regulator [Geovibrio sp.]|jgi:Rrf2 family protein|uniref:RrF2 family transcriptional regulator n=1 Tax=Geovibrio ferrireducens TaxID=46201 RepID=UPI0022469117|nr:Rrf2 family transcriptional regulator [Geovibrio ferrireducens]MCD8566921.1 Rrf2 family transcriptional regulator [Geovibrio sp.]
MKITTKSRYAIRAIYALVVLGGDREPVALTQIAQMETISRKYLEQIFIQLKKYNIVTGSRGAGGGYMLSKDAAGITVKDVVVAMDGPISPVDCTDGEDCSKFSTCAINWLWLGLKKNVDNYLENITIDDLKKHALGGKNAHLSGL